MQKFGQGQCICSVANYSASFNNIIKYKTNTSSLDKEREEVKDKKK
jgi:hypothetical protein